MNGMTRRDAVLLAGLLVAPRPGRWFPARQDDLAAWLERHVDSGALAELGAAYRARHPAESSVAALTRLLAEGRRAGESLGRHLSRSARADFEAGRVEELSGWMLAKTEARLVAAATGL